MWNPGSTPRRPVRADPNCFGGGDANAGMSDRERSGDAGDADRGVDDASDADGADAGGDAEAAETVKRTRPCPYCGASMNHRHCKYVCPEHGVVFDCADTFY